MHDSELLVVEKGHLSAQTFVDGVAAGDLRVELLHVDGAPGAQLEGCGKGYGFSISDAFVFFHPKGSIPVEDTYQFRKYYEEGYQFVVGSRMMKGAHNEEDDKLLKPRKWFVLGLGVLAKLLFQKEGNTIWDTLHGFRGMTVEAFKRCRISDMSPSIDIEMVCRSYKLRLKRIEFPTTEMPRIAGETHFKAFSTGKKLLKYVWFEIRRGNIEE